ncbi:30S ribosomal protein S5 [Mycoplasma sp. 394]
MENQKENKEPKKDYKVVRPTTGTKEVRPRRNINHKPSNSSEQKPVHTNATDRPNRGSKTENRFKKPANRDNRRNKEVSEYSEKVIDIARVTKVVKGGRRFSFSAFVVIGNKKGSVGYGHGKANEVPDAIKKAIKDAKNNLISVPFDSKSPTIPHEVYAKFLASKVMLKPASKGKGLIASGTVRAVAELAGYSDIVTKTYGSRSKTNTVKATVKALRQLRTPEQIAEIRNKDVKDLR